MEDFNMPETKDKALRYDALAKHIERMTARETNMTANMANAAALLKQAFGFFWCGFYLKDGDELVLGPFQGKPACIRIQVGKGVCGTAVATGETQLVADVHAFPGHIACDGASNSEIVVPIKNQGQVVAVLDLDSPLFARFDAEDQIGLERVAAVLEKFDWNR